MKKAKKYILLGLMLLAILSSCSEEPEIHSTYNSSSLSSEIATPMPTLDVYVSPSIAPTAFDVTFEVEAESKQGKPFFTIHTNLPDGAQLLLTLKGADNSIAQDKVTVIEGVAVSTDFSDKGSPLIGDYTLTVSMGLPRLQSDEVQAVIGTHGEYMAGEFTYQDEISGDTLFCVSDIPYSFPLSSDESACSVPLRDSKVIFESHSVLNGFKTEALFDIGVGKTNKELMTSLSSDEFTEFTDSFDFDSWGYHSLVLLFEDGTGMTFINGAHNICSDYGYVDVTEGNFEMVDRLGCCFNDGDGWYYRTVEEMRTADEADLEK